MSAISEHASLPGNFCSGILLIKPPRISSEVGTSHFSFIKVGLVSGHSCSLKRLSARSSVSFTELSKTVTSAAWIVIRVSYAVVHSSPREDIWSSKMDNDVFNLVRNIVVCAGLFAAVVTENVRDFCVVDIVRAVHSGYILK